MFSEVFTRLSISSLIEFHSEYYQKMLQEDSRDYMAFQTMQNMYRPPTLVQGAIYSISAFVGVSWKILNTNLGLIAEILIDDVGVIGPNSRYGEEEVEGLPGVRRLVMEHLQILVNVLANVERAGETLSRVKFDWSWNSVKIVWCVCGEARLWPEASEVNKVSNHPRRKNRTECRAFFRLCTCY